MKRLFSGLASLILGLIMLSVVAPLATASAANIFPECQSSTGSAVAASTDVCHSVQSQTGSGSSPILKTMKTAINIISFIIGIASVIVIIVAGIQMIIGGDNPQTIETARNMIIYALVGVAVAVLAQSIVVFVLKNVG